LQYEPVLLGRDKKRRGVIQGAMTHNLLPEEMDLGEKRLSILHKISNAIVFTDNIHAVAELMLDLAVTHTNAEAGSLMLVNETGELSIFAARGLDNHLVDTYKEKIGEGIAGVVAMERRPVLVEDIDKDNRFKSKKRNHYKTNSFISCPVICKDRLLGVFNINDKKNGEHFREEEFALITIIANQAAITIENALLVSQLRTKAARLEDINRKLVEDDEAKTEFLTRVSHDLRTPLNSIKGSIYYLGRQEHITAEKQREFFDIIAREAAELADNVEHLLNFLRRENETRIKKIGDNEPYQPNYLARPS
jgi:K+-sensing histidine kinase KdpD